jgi:hypothetical protein
MTRESEPSDPPPVGRAEDLDGRIDEIYAYGGQVPIPDPRLPSDPIFTEMVRLSSQPERVRDEALEPHLMGWVDRGMDRLTIARYLAAAGLTRREGEELEATVRVRMAGSMRIEAYASMLGGLSLFAAACWVMIDRVFPFWGILGVVLAATALVSMLRGAQLLRRSVPASREEL